MKTYQAKRNPETGTWYVLEHTVVFEGLSEAEAREAVEQFTLAQARLQASYRAVERARTDADSILRGIG